jgi:hypothetical protein
LKDLQTTILTPPEVQIMPQIELPEPMQRTKKQEYNAVYKLTYRNTIVRYLYEFHIQMMRKEDKMKEKF